MHIKKTFATEISFTATDQALSGACTGLEDIPGIPKAEFDAALAALIEASPKPLSVTSPMRPRAKPSAKRC